MSSVPDVTAASSPLSDEPSTVRVTRARTDDVPNTHQPVARTGGRTTRVVVRRLDTWSMLKLSIVYYLALFVVLLVAALLLWAGATAIGVVGNIESFMVDIGFEDFRFIPSELLGGLALGGLVLVVAGTFANVLLTALFNLMSDVMGGVKLTLQEDVESGRRGKSTV